MTYIHPDLVMKRIKNNFIVGNVVIPKNGLSFWAQRVHMVISKARG
jgi:hypothetical protein